MHANSYDSYEFGGMHYVWWIIWIIILIWLFVLPYNFPRKKRKNETPLDILKVRLALGEITEEEFQTKKKLLREV